MEKQSLTYTFENPGGDGMLVRAFLQILIDRLAAPPDGGAAAGESGGGA